MYQKEENLTENHATPMVSKQPMKKTQVVHEERAFCRKTKNEGRNLKSEKSQD
jgi:hypothetical protein